MVKTSKMLMTPYEIARSYKMAGNKEQQLGILAQLNVTSRERIIEIIEDYTEKVASSDEEYRMKKEKHQATSARIISGGKHAKKLWELAI